MVNNNNMTHFNKIISPILLLILIVTLWLYSSGHTSTCSNLFNKNIKPMYDLFKVNNTKLTIKIQENRQWDRLSLFIVNFEQISHKVLAFFFLITQNMICQPISAVFHFILKLAMSFALQMSKFALTCPADIYLLKVNNKNTRTRLFWLWTHFTPCSSASTVNFELVISGWLLSKFALKIFHCWNFLTHFKNLWFSNVFRGV